MTENPFAAPSSPPPLPPGARSAWNARWTCFWLLVLFLGWQIFGVIAFYLIVFFNGIFSENPESAAILSTDGDVNGLVAFALLFVVCPACWLIGQSRPGWSGWEYLGKARVKWWQWPLWSVVIIACAFTFNLLAPGLGIEDPDPSMVEMASSTQVPLFLYLGVGIGAPLVEEFIFRGAIWRGWRESRLGFIGTLLLTSFCWAALHEQYPLVIIVYLFTLGLVLGIAREVTGSLWVPVWMHALNNGLATAQMLSL